MDDYESASLLRNKTDHLNDNIHKLANSTQRRPSIFGSISYVAIPNSELACDETGPNPTRGFITTVTAGPINGSQRFRAATQFDQPVRLPVDALYTRAVCRMVVA